MKNIANVYIVTQLIIKDKKKSGRIAKCMRTYQCPLISLFLFIYIYFNLCSFIYILIVNKKFMFGEKII